MFEELEEIKREDEGYWNIARGLCKQIQGKCTSAQGSGGVIEV